MGNVSEDKRLLRDVKEAKMTNEGARGMTLANEMSNVSVNNEKQSEKQPKCYFTSIAGEIRNQIYEYAFTPFGFECNSDEDAQIHLFLEPGVPVDHARNIRHLHSIVPASNLILTCKQISREAKPALEETCRKSYWVNNTFHVNIRKFNTIGRCVGAVVTLAGLDVAWISRVMLHAGDLRIELEDGIWTVRNLNMLRLLFFSGTPITRKGRKYIVFPKGSDKSLLTDASLHVRQLIKSADESEGPQSIRAIDVTDVDAKKVQRVLRQIGRLSLTKTELVDMMDYAVVALWRIRDG